MGQRDRGGGVKFKCQENLFSKMLNLHEELLKVRERNYQNKK